jgi:transposase-like protein
LITLPEPFNSYDWFRDKDFLTREYMENQKSTAQIARELGCARSTIVKFLLDFGIELRRDGLPHYRKSQLAYGEKIYGGRIVPHLSEVRIIEQFLALRNEGRSYAKLAHWANNQGILTKNRTRRWDRRTIFEILRRFRLKGTTTT